MLAIRTERYIRVNAFKTRRCVGEEVTLWKWMPADRRFVAVGLSDFECGLANLSTPRYLLNDPPEVDARRFRR